MKMHFALGLLLAGLACAVSVGARAAEEEEVFSARLRIDNLIEFRWRTDSAVKTVNIYGKDSPDALERVQAAAGVSAASNGYLYDFLTGGNAYHYYYDLELINQQGTVIDTKTVETHFFITRISKEITNLEHPYMLTTPSGIEETKRKIEQYPFYQKQLERLMDACDGYLEQYAELNEPFEVNGMDNYSSPVFKAAEAAGHLGIAYVLTDNPGYAAMAAKILKIYARTYEVIPYLNTQKKDDSRIIIVLSEAYDLIYSTLSGEDRAYIENGYFRTAVERVNVINRQSMDNMGQIDWAVMSAAMLLKDQDYFDMAWYSQPGRGLYYTMINGLLDDGSWWEQSVMYHHSRTTCFFNLAEYFQSANYDLYNHNWTGVRDPNSSVKRSEGDNMIVERKTIKEFLDFLFNYTLSNLDFPYFSDIYTYQSVVRYTTECEKAWARYGDERSRWVLVRAYGAARQKSGNMDFRNFFLSKPELGAAGYVINNQQFAQRGYSKLGASVFNDTGAAVLRSEGGAVSGTDLAVQWSRYGTASHNHADKLSIILYSKGQEILVDPGAYTYRTVPRTEYAVHTIAHNTVTVDEQSQMPTMSSLTNEEWSSDEKTGLFTGGELLGLSIGPNSRAIAARNDNVYEFLDVKMNRTLWQIDDYVVDVFEAESPVDHQYDYPLTVNGQLTFLSSYMKSRAPAEVLGQNYGYRYIREIADGRTGKCTWESEWKISDKVNFRTTMLGGPDMTEIITGKGIGEDKALKTYDKNLLIARRRAQSTAFVTILDPYEGAGHRTVTELDAGTLNGEKVYAFTVKSRQNQYIDTFAYAKGSGVKKANGLETDAKSALRREQDGEDMILGMMGGTWIKGRDVTVTTSVPTSFQLTKMLDGCYRLDMGEISGANVTVTGLDGYKVFRMALSDEVVLEEYADIPSFAAEPNGIYIISKDGAETRMAPPLVVHMGLLTDVAAPLMLRITDALPDGILVEAEDLAEESGGKLSFSNSGGSHTTSHPQGSSIFNWNNKGHTLRWTFTVPKDGKYKLCYRFATTAENAVRLIDINGGQSVVCWFEPTSAWSDRRNGTVVGEDGADLVVELKKGENILTMENVSGQALNLDYILFVPAE